MLSLDVHGQKLTDDKESELESKNTSILLVILGAYLCELPFKLAKNYNASI